MRALETMLATRFSEGKNMVAWLARMEDLRDAVLYEATIFDDPFGDPTPPISPRFFRNILLANIPQRWLICVAPDTDTWDDVTTSLRQFFLGTHSSPFDSLPHELVRHILLFALPPLRVVLSDPPPSRPKGTAFQKTTIMSAVERQRALHALQLVSRRWYALLGAQSDFAARNINKVLVLTQQLSERSGMCSDRRSRRSWCASVIDARGATTARTGALVLVAKAARSQGGDDVGALLEYCTHLEELHFGGTKLGYKDFGGGGGIIEGGRRCRGGVAAPRPEGALHSRPVDHRRHRGYLPIPHNVCVSVFKIFLLAC